ncbi:MAG: exosortase/archaeosortase family protein [Gammaproteobacteria bacterium]
MVANDWRRNLPDITLSAIAPHQIHWMLNMQRVAICWPLFVATAAFWPVWIWYAQRLNDGSGEVWELVSIATALLVLVLRPVQNRTAARCLIAPVCVLVVYVCTYKFLPPLLRAGLAFSVLAILASSYRGARRFDVGIWGLFMLALPVVASFQFAFAYPMRVLIGWFAVPLLNLTGFMVTQQGTLLMWGERQIVIDAPCSGIHMLWAGAYLAFSAMCVCDLNRLASISLLVITAAAILAANILRVSSLFFLETDIVAGPAFGHDATDGFTNLADHTNKRS